MALIFQIIGKLKKKIRDKALKKRYIEFIYGIPPPHVQLGLQMLQYS